MPKICYVPKTFRKDSIEIIGKAIAIAEAYAQQGYELTLRQLYYQFVSRGWLQNTESNYHRLGNIINDARLAGLVDWNYLTDRTRWVRENSHWSNPTRIMDSVVTSYAHEKWLGQPERPIVMIEKDALVGVIQGVCEELDVPHFSCRGYTSQSEMWSISQRIRGYIKKGQRVVILHLGDHDPSGIDMSRDIQDRLALFISHDQGEEDVPELDRLALNIDQIQQYNPPPNPAKATDSRFRDYADKFGYESWELDALDPTVISDLVRTAILAHRDDDLWDDAVADEDEKRTQLQDVRDRWQEVVDFLDS